MQRDEYTVTFTVQWKVMGTSHDEAIGRVKDAIDGALKADRETSITGGLEGPRIKSAVVLEAGSSRKQ